MANIQIDITQNGTTTLATEGCYCDSDVNVNVSVPLRYDEGRQAERDGFWEKYQDYGNRRDYQYAFSYVSDEHFSPKYPIVTTDAAYLVQKSSITDLKVDVDCSGAASIGNVFYNAPKLKRIPKVILKSDGSQTMARAFSALPSLEDIVIEGVIGASVTFQSSTKLSKASIESVFGALSNTTSGLTLTLSQTAKQNAFTDVQWAALVATKPNWTISLV